MDDSIPRIAVLGKGDWIPLRGEGFGEIGGVSVEVVRMAIDAPPLNI